MAWTPQLRTTEGRAGKDLDALASAADERARNAEARAERARWHAATASGQAEQDGAAGNVSHQLRHQQEAELHERAAAHQAAAAERQRRHAAHLRGTAT